MINPFIQSPHGEKRIPVRREDEVFAQAYGQNLREASHRRVRGLVARQAVD